MADANIKIESTDSDALIRHFTLFSGFLDKLPLAFYYSKVSNDRWVVEFLSDGITRLLGYAKEEIVGKMGFVDLNMDKDIYKTIPITSDSKTNEFGFLYTLRTKHNTPKRVIDKGMLVFDHDGNLEGATGVLMDFTLDSGFDILDYLPAGARPQKKIKNSLDEIIGHSKPMRNVIQRILKIAPTNGHVLIQGESGTGKELTARAIHELSGKFSRPFIAINCGAISENLLESEFFGHVKGAFSGATDNRKGYLDVVDNGTLFLDEVGEMPLNMQVKLLRVLDGYGYTPVGSTKARNSHFRLICATNRNLETSLEVGIMRQDFYHRIKQLTITLPPLRERTEDIEALIDAFADRFFSDNQLLPPSDGSFMPPEIKKKFLAHHWPGNVRELHHAVIKYLSIGEIEFSPESNNMKGPAMEGSYAPPLTGLPIKTEMPRSFAEYEKEALLSALNECGWDVAKAAVLLKQSKRTIQRKISKYELK